jgi:8-oxo-dGTP pyrophosphatase MutT (NUDIX family)
VTTITSLLQDASEIAPPDVVGRALELDRLGDATNRDRFDPGHFTASGFVVSPGGSALLLVHHRRLDRWLQPGGHIDPGDASPAAAAVREVLEETGIATEPILQNLIDLDIHPIPPRAPEPRHEHFDLRFALQARDDEVVVDDEVNDAVWVPWSKIHSYAVDDSVIRGVAGLRRVCS